MLLFISPFTFLLVTLCSHWAFHFVTVLSPVHTVAEFALPFSATNCRRNRRL